ncbi:hypothetical protein GCM10010218_64100 [Streptomyces mashuensis]|uniref:Uncharacterized protein n=1 Tax=Streptomyces mashuensis TaxID=33904 RepID=A0A919EGR4_9ACTN|nr:hypothetical protein [Streptomyces mashuensis]GHF74163.1 hypothetical protein GCM10010218_64100 [Streptomyces mashuensis]
MYSLNPGHLFPAVQRGLSPAETLLTKMNLGAGGALLMSAFLSPPPAWTFGAVGAAGALLNVAPGPRSVARWAAVGYRRLREKTAPAAVFDRPGATATWELYPEHGTMQDPLRRAAFHDAFSRALTFAGGQARTAGIQVHVTHRATVDDYVTHGQTISVHVPKGLAGQPDRILGTLEGEVARLGALMPVEPDPVPAVAERGPGWVLLDDGRYAATARVTAWPDDTDGDLMQRLLLGDGHADRQDPHFTVDRSFAVLYRPLPPAQSRRSAKWRAALAGAFTTDTVKKAAHEIASSTTHGALVQGAILVDVDAYLTVWGDSPESVSDARWHASLTADRHRIRLDWLAGQQHRAHVMTTPHGASTRKGAIL